MGKYERERLYLLISFLEEVFEYCRENKFRKPRATDREISFFILITEIIDVAKSIIYLYDNEARIGVDSLIRIAFEKKLFVYLINEDSKYATPFLLSLQINNLAYIKNIEDGDEFSQSLAKKLGKSLNELQENAKRVFTRDNEEERRSKLIESYRNCFEFDTNERKIFKLKWYSLDDKTSNICDLARKIGQIDLYNVLYRTFSSEVHSLTLSSSFKFSEIDESSYIGYLADESYSSLGFNDNSLAFIIDILVDIYNVLVDKFELKSKYRAKYSSIILKSMDPNKLL